MKIHCIFASEFTDQYYGWRFKHMELAHGVTGNTSGFGPEESRFET